MIITKTPLRVSFFGGGSDYPEWYLRNGGQVLSTTIDKYVFLMVRRLPPFFDYENRLVWSKIELTESVDAIEHPVVKTVLQKYGLQKVEVNHFSDLPARTGLGSSSSFAVGLINAVRALLENEPESSHQLALEAIEVEKHMLGEVVGVQDQLAAAHGGFNIFHFGVDATLRVQKVNFEQDKLASLQKNLVMVYTGVARFASQVAASTVANFGTTKDSVIHRIVDMVDEGRRSIDASDITAFGELLHESWLLKRSLSTDIAPEMINQLYALGRQAGALGGKVLGAGGGGFMLFVVPPESRQRFLNAMSNFLVIPFGFDDSGSSIIYRSDDQFTHASLKPGVKYKQVNSD